MCVRLKTKTCGCYNRISQNGRRNVEEMAISSLFFVACYCWSVNDWSYFSFKDRTAAGLSVFVTQEAKGENCSCGHLGGFLWKFQQLNNHYTPLFIKRKKKKLWQSYNLKVFLSEISSVKHNATTVCYVKATVQLLKTKQPKTKLKPTAIKKNRWYLAAHMWARQRRQEVVECTLWPS